MDNKMMKVMFSSQKGNWETPNDLFKTLDEEFNFNLDVCATKETAKVSRFFEGDEGLRLSWKESRCWMNPPYGREIGEWLRKAREEVATYKGTMDRVTVVALLPVRSDTNWFWEHILEPGFEIRLIKGRLRFLQEGKAPEGGAPFPSMIVIFK